MSVVINFELDNLIALEPEKSQLAKTDISMQGWFVGKVAGKIINVDYQIVWDLLKEKLGIENE